MRAWWWGCIGRERSRPGAPFEHPAWPGYKAILELLRSELREFLVVGDRDFDLGFEVVVPQVVALRDVVGADWGPRIGFFQTWTRTNHVVLRAGSRVYLIVTRSEVSEGAPVTEFEFGHPPLFPAQSTPTVLWPPGAAAPGPGATLRWSDTLSGIDARVYRLELG